MTPLSYIKIHFTSRFQKGFTLVELIITIVLVGLVGVFTTLFVYTGLNGYLLAKDTSEGALTAQIALDRISMELRDIEKINDFTQNSQIDYNNRKLGDNRKILHNAGVISLDNGSGARDLLDGVTNFAMTLMAADLDNSTGAKEEVQAIDVSFNVGEIGRVFSVRIFPRNMVSEP
jgi:prepilin-type N-terminal cleavage/methylation domain-containing protein